MSSLAGCTKFLFSGLACIAVAVATPAATAQAATQPQTAPSAQTSAPAKPTQGAPTPPPAQGTTPGSPAAQNNEAPADDLATTTIRTTVNEVDLVFTVTDKKGHFVTGLNQSSFGLRWRA